MLSMKQLKETMKVEFKTQLDALLEEKNKEIETLKTQLSKEPESQPIREKKTVESEVKLTKEGKILQAIRNAQ